MEPLPLSKTQAKREKKRAAWLETLAERKLKRKARKALHPSAPKPPKPPLLFKTNHEEWLRRKNAGLRLIIDCEFDSLLTDKEHGSLKQQLMYCYSAIRKSDQPCQLTFSGVTERLMSDLTRVSVGNWEVEISKEPYIGMFPKERLVYLTADAEVTLSTLDETKMYIIGGLVDHNRLKKATFNKAEEQGIATAKLPLADHLEITTTKVLTVNHVVSIIVNYRTCQDWGKSLISVLPSRKKAKVREGEEEEKVEEEEEGNSSAEEENAQIPEAE